jgi:hypothetical protein
LPFQLAQEELLASAGAEEEADDAGAAGEDETGAAADDLAPPGSRSGRTAQPAKARTEIKLPAITAPFRQANMPTPPRQFLLGAQYCAPQPLTQCRRVEIPGRGHQGRTPQPFASQAGTIQQRAPGAEQLICEQWWLVAASSSLTTSGIGITCGRNREAAGWRRLLLMMADDQ